MNRLNKFIGISLFLLTNFCKCFIRMLSSCNNYHKYVNIKLLSKLL
jgi:hypothetical protein